MTYEFTKTYRTNYGVQLGTFSLSEHAIPHILMRHVVPFKIYERKAKSTLNMIKNYLGKMQSVSAIVNEQGHISVIGDDGVFYLPDFNTKEDYYSQTGGKITKQIIKESAFNLYKLLSKIVEILAEKYDNNKSPNIIYLKGVLYGIEVNKHQGNTIDSFYPLNSDFQKKNGILKKDFDRIVNKDAIPDDFLRIIDNE